MNVSSLPLLVSCLSGVAAFALVLGIGRVARRRRVSVADKLRDLEQQRRGQASQPPWSAGAGQGGRVAMTIDRLAGRTDFAQQLTDDLTQADVKLTAGEYIVIIALVMALGVLLSFWMGNPALAVVIVLAAYIVPRQWLNRRRARRIKQFNARLPATIGLIASTMRSGSNLAQALEMAAREEPAPISTELGRVVREMSISASLADALKHLGERVPSKDLELFITSLLVQHEAGGDLVQMLGSISETIRERIKLNAEVQSQTAQQRFSGYVVSLMPVGMSLVLLVINPKYILGPLRTTHWCGLVMYGTAGVMIVVGFVVIQKMVNVKI